MSNINDGSLWDNPMVRAARNALSKEDIEKYKKIGEDYFNSVNFETSEVNNSHDPMHEVVNYIESMIQSGLHISDLTKDEAFMMSEIYGDEWYKKYGYSKDDLPTFDN